MFGLNLKRGFFRIWAVFSALVVLGTAIVTVQEAKRPFFSVEYYVLKQGSFVSVDNTSDVARLEQVADAIEFPNELVLLIAKSVSQSEKETRAREFFKLHGVPREAEAATRRNEAILTGIGVAIGVPLLTLLVGIVLAWIAAGFRKDTPR